MTPEDTEIPPALLQIINYGIEYMGTVTDDWFRIKKELANLFPPEERSRFSRRHYSTKKHILNLFDKSVITYWEKTTGIKLRIDPKKLHPENWVQRKHGWGLREFNEKRRKQRHQEVSSEIS
jgi:hypothetical protein